MPRSSGTYTPPAGNPVVAGTVISSAVQNNTINDIGNELTNSIPRDGTAPPTANLPMGNFKITGLGAATLATDVPQYQQIQSGASLYLTAVAGTNTITGTLASPTLTAYAAGNTFRFTAAGANTGAVTLNINGLGAKAITKSGTGALSSGDINSGATVEVIYDGTQFQLVSVQATAIQAQTNTSFTTGGTSSAFTLTPTPAITANTTNQRFNVTLNAAPTGSPTLAVSGQTAANFKYYDSTGTKQFITSAVAPNGWRSDVIYDGTDWVMQSVLLADATTTLKGKVQLATSAEAIAGTDATKAITPATLFGGLNATGTAPIYACRAWVNFNGTGTVAIRGSGNVSSITDNGVGDYTINFTTAMPDANYAISGGGKFDDTASNAATPGIGLIRQAGSIVASSCRIGVSVPSTGAAFDATYVTLAIFR